VCDLETSRMGAPYIYDISRLRVKQIHQNNKISINKTLIKPVVLWKCNLDPNTDDRTNPMYI